MDPTERAGKYKEKYAQGVIIRDHSLEEYNRFLHTAGENQTIEKIIHRILRRKETCQLLDIGCGNGNALHTLKKLYHSRLITIGMDLIPPQQMEGIDTFIEGDVHAQTIPTECDLILSFRALHEMGKIAHLLSRIGESLSKGGRAYAWIRMRDRIGGKTVFLGEMNETEEKELISFSSKQHAHYRVLCNPSIMPIKEKETSSTFIAGYSIMLYAPL
ncbi:MAG: class I SAM-dependent methyltransferase [Candidatus Diapherotrites archaeon]